jgi:Zn-dependent protease
VVAPILLCVSTLSSPDPEPKAPEASKLEATQTETTDSAPKKRNHLVSIGISLLLALKTILLLLPKLKFATTGISMVISIGFYALIFGWPFAIGFVLLILVHEYGHVLQAKREGLAVTAPVFIPFLGAAIMMKEMPKNAAVEARIGIAGPILGSLACLVPFALWQTTGESLWQALTYTGVFINLFNLLPVLPLDGGRVMSAVSTKVWAVGFAALIGGAVVFASPFLVLIALFGGLELWGRYKAGKRIKKKQTMQERVDAFEQMSTITLSQQTEVEKLKRDITKTKEALGHIEDYHNVPRRTRIGIATAYLLLAAVLGWATMATYVHHDDYQKERTQTALVR